MILVVTSGKGGVGKSTVSVGIASALCKNGKRVLLTDADEGLRCLDLLLGAGADVMLDVADATSSPDLIRSAAVKVPSVDGLYLLAAPSKFGEIDGERFGRMIEESDKLYDCVIVDCPAGIDEKYYKSLPVSSKFIIVTNSDSAAWAGAMKMGMMLRKLGFNELRLVLNKFSGKKVGKLHENVDTIIDKTGIGLIGIVPYDDEIISATAKQTPAVYGRAAMAFFRIGARVLGSRIQLPKDGRI